MIKLYKVETFNASNEQIVETLKKYVKDKYNLDNTHNAGFKISPILNVGAFAFSVGFDRYLMNIPMDDLLKILSPNKTKFEVQSANNTRIIYEVYE